VQRELADARHAGLAGLARWPHHPAGVQRKFDIGLSLALAAQNSPDVGRVDLHQRRFGLREHFGQQLAHGRAGMALHIGKCSGQTGITLHVDIVFKAIERSASRRLGSLHPLPAFQAQAQHHVACGQGTVSRVEVARTQSRTPHRTQPQVGLHGIAPAGGNLKFEFDFHHVVSLLKGERK